MFSVEIPVSQAALEARIVTDVPTLSAPLAGMEILAIDNEPAILDAMETLLKNWGCDVRIAADLAEARLAAHQFAAGPDVVIADYHLDHDATGLEAISALRDQFGREIAAILVTADRSQSVREEADIMAVTVLHKPLKPASLRALLAQWRAKRVRSAAE
jgi:CheY-like chemotaxis protein